jgi:hypothetical protein
MVVVGVVVLMNGEVVVEVGRIDGRREARRFGEASWKRSWGRGTLRSLACTSPTVLSQPQQK